MATVSPDVMFIWRMLLKTVTPAQRRGAKAAGSTSEGMLTVASVRRRQYSATAYQSAFSVCLERREGRLTSAVTGDAVDLFLHAGLIKAPLALLAVACGEPCQLSEPCLQV